LLIVLVILAVVVAVVVRHVVYPALSWNRDEATYLWQVRALRDGQLMTTTGGLPQFFQPWLTGVRDGQFFSQYTLGWPAVMFVADLVFGSPALSTAFGTALAVLGSFLLVNELTRDRVLAVVTSALLLASPMVITQSGVYLSYLFSLGVGLLFGAALLAGLRRRSAGLLVAAGLLLGVAFVTRPYDAVLWAVAFGGYGIFVSWGDWRQVSRAAARLALGFLPFLVLTLVHNRVVTGSFKQFAFSAKEPLDKFGFGFRRLLPEVSGVDYTVKEAIRGVTTSGSHVPQFLVGSYVGILLAGVGLWFRRRDRTTVLLLVLMVVFPAGYFLFWGSRLASRFAFLSGPVYLLPLFVPLCLFIATALLALWRRRPGLLVVAALVIAIATVPFLYDASAKNHRLSAAQEPWEHATDGLPGRSLVVVRDSGPYLLHLNPFSLNQPDLDGRVLYSVDRGAATFNLLDHYPDRTAYIERTNFPRLDNALDHPDAKVPTIQLLPVRVVTGPVVTLDVVVRNPTKAPAVVATLVVGGSRVEQRILQPSPEDPEVYRTQWTLAPRVQASSHADAVPLTGRGTFSVSAAMSATATQAPGERQLRTQYVYRVHQGDVQVLAPPRKSVVYPVPGGVVQHDVGGLSKLGVHVAA
jgi:4-amino-4-deoxy-L-arabinose transferase-like glycosyltransferase